MLRSLPHRRLPGVRFELPAPAPDEVLPRMDIAFFVGFATRGPLGRAVAVESLTEFEAVYGMRIVLARDKRSGDPVQGLLHPAVRSFFSQGGRRCWVLRVTGEEVQAAVFPVPSMLLAQRSAGGWRVAPALLLAGSPGSGADALRVSARLDVKLLRVRPLPSSPGDLLLLDAAASGLQDVRSGDLLRIEVEGRRVHGRIDSIEDHGAQRRVMLRGLLALRAAAGASPALEVRRIERSVSAAPTSPDSVAAEGEWDDAGRLRVRCRLPASALPQRGEVIRLQFAQLTDGGWMSLEHVDLLQAAEPGRWPELALFGRPWLEDAAIDALAAWQASAQERVAQVLRLELQAQDAVTTTVSAPLRMAASAQQRQGSAFGLDEGTGFPLAAPPQDGELMWLPLAELADFEAGLGPLPSALSALERDGLARFSWTLFAEPVLSDCASDVLADRAEALRHAGRELRPLRGMHALFGGRAEALINEPTLLAVPDAVHPGWLPVPRIEVWVELPTLPEPPNPCAGEAFKDCDAVPLPAPRFLKGDDPDAEGSFTLYWTQVVPGATYRLEE
ncbi:hypothetical protein OOT46_29335, partial [Aquabacterium sp. A7-Y]|nr:hypothetical protein [Aquabacterium sp. A7-Y]